MGFHAPLLAELYAQSAAAGDPVKNVLIWEEGYTSKNGQSITAWAVEENGLYAYLRQTEEQTVLCAVNTALEPVTARMKLPEKMRTLKVLHDLYSGNTVPVEDGEIRVSLAVGEGLILQ